MNTDLRQIAYAAQLADEFKIVYNGSTARSKKQIHRHDCTAVKTRTRNVPASRREIADAVDGLAPCCAAHAERYNDLASVAL